MLTLTRLNKSKPVWVGRSQGFRISLELVDGRYELTLSFKYHGKDRVYTGMYSASKPSDPSWAVRHFVGFWNHLRAVDAGYKLLENDANEGVVWKPEVEDGS